MVSQISPKLPSSRKWLVGCSLGCGGLVLFLFLILIAFLVWLTAESAHPDPAAFLSQESVAIGVLSPDFTNPALMSAFQRMRADSTEMRRMLSLIKGGVKKGDHLLQAVWIVGPAGAEGNMSQVAIVSIRRFKGLMELIRRGVPRRAQNSPEISLLSHGEDRIRVDPKRAGKLGHAMCLPIVRGRRGLGTFLMLSDHPDGLRKALDRFHSNSQLTSTLTALMARLPQGWDGYLVILNKDGSFTDWAVSRHISDAAARDLEMERRIREGLRLILSGWVTLHLARDADPRIVAELDLVPGSDTVRLTTLLDAWSDEARKEGRLKSLERRVVGDALHVEAILPPLESSLSAPEAASRGVGN